LPTKFGNRPKLVNKKNVLRTKKSLSVLRTESVPLFYLTNIYQNDKIYIAITIAF